MGGKRSGCCFSKYISKYISKYGWMDGWMDEVVCLGLRTRKGKEWRKEGEEREEGEEGEEGEEREEGEVGEEKFKQGSLLPGRVDGCVCVCVCVRGRGRGREGGREGASKMEGKKREKCRHRTVTSMSIQMGFEEFWPPAFSLLMLQVGWLTQVGNSTIYL